MDNGEWVYGFLTCYAEKVAAIQHWNEKGHLTGYGTDPESVGQWTGIEDVYEGDIAKTFSYFYECGMQSRGYLESECKYEVVTFRDGAFYVGRTLLSNADYEIIGNVFDNGDLYDC